MKKNGVIACSILLVSVQSMYAGKSVSGEPTKSSELVPLVQQQKVKNDVESKELQELTQCAEKAMRTICAYDGVYQPLNNTGYILQTRDLLLNACSKIKKIGVAQVPAPLREQVKKTIAMYSAGVPNARYVWQGSEDEQWINERYPIIEFPRQ